MVQMNESQQYFVILIFPLKYDRSPFPEITNFNKPLLKVEKKNCNCLELTSIENIIFTSVRNKKKIMGENHIMFLFYQKDIEAISYVRKQAGMKHH